MGTHQEVSRKQISNEATWPFPFGFLCLIVLSLALPRFIYFCPRQRSNLELLFEVVLCSSIVAAVAVVTWLSVLALFLLLLLSLLSTQ